MQTNVSLFREHMLCKVCFFAVENSEFDRENTFTKFFLKKSEKRVREISHYYV